MGAERADRETKQKNERAQAQNEQEYQEASFINDRMPILNPHTINQNNIYQLQRLYGNAHVQRILAAKNQGIVQKQATPRQLPPISGIRSTRKSSDASSSEQTDQDQDVEQTTEYGDFGDLPHGPPADGLPPADNTSPNNRLSNRITPIPEIRATKPLTPAITQLKRIDQSLHKNEAMDISHDSKQVYNKQRHTVNTQIQGNKAIQRNWFTEAGEWAVRIPTILANPVGALMSGVWMTIPDRFKPRIINVLLDNAATILRHLQGAMGAAMGLLWPLISSMMLGFIRRMRQVADNTKIAMSNRLANLLTGGSITFALHFAKGLALAAWDVIRSPYDLIVGIIDGVQFIARALSNLSTQDLLSAFSLIQNGFGAAWDGLVQMVRNPSRAMQFLRLIWSSILQATQQVGRGLAEAILNFFQLPDAQMGEQSGRFAGSIVIDVALSVLLPAIGGALRRALGVIQQFMRAFRATRAGGRIFRMIHNIVSPLRQGLQSMGRLFNRGTFGRWIRGFRDFIGRMMNAADEAIENAGRRLRGGRRTPVDAPSHRPRTRHHDADGPDNRRRRRDNDDDDNNRRRDDDDNEADFQRKVATIRTRVAILLRGGISGARLRQQLMSLKVRHRVRRLYLEPSGPRPDIVIQRQIINRDVFSLNEIMTDHLDEILDVQMANIDTNVLRDVGTDIITGDEATEAFERIRHQRAMGAGDADNLLDITGSGDMSNRLGMARDNIHSGRNIGHTEHYRMGQHGDTDLIAETTMNPTRTGLVRTPSVLFVQGLGTYEEILDMLARFPLNNQQLGQAMLSIARTGRIPHGIAPSLDPQTLAQLTHLHFDVEMSRSLAAVVTAPNIAQMLANGQVSLGEAFGNLNAMSIQGGNHPLYHMDRQHLRRQDRADLADSLRSLNDAGVSSDHVRMQSDITGRSTMRYGPDVQHRSRLYDPESGMTMTGGAQGQRARAASARDHERRFLKRFVKNAIQARLRPQNLKFDTREGAIVKLNQEVREYLDTHLHGELNSNTRNILGID